jgi:glucokinase
MLLNDLEAMAFAIPVLLESELHVPMSWLHGDTNVATAGVFVGGGIAPKILLALTDGRFMRVHRQSTFTELLERIPVKVILNDEAGVAWRRLRALLIKADAAAAKCSRWGSL